ncbi:fumarylacetoacetate hydrolase family protein [Phenylobacterium montanum]|uniref:Fumarylacetoacetate hydrolase family protein n=1 Tax=Phenylobacterium montanum TaxID=2823693 RepID=A0A975FV98_9CAUL|nr:fumarylacetoacetate hydrolase family protein [Caulobacter sp. S6]QUD85939.1 fumarylacetoacetate hydrolase family protein [Caulobacter sp. S6]
MRLATMRAGGRDGRLVVVSSDLSRCAGAAGIAPTLQDALDNWATAAPELEALQQRLDDGLCADAAPFDPAHAMAPLPRAWQWLDASAYPSHGELMAKVLGIAPELYGAPLMYQGLSDHFIGPTENVPLPDEEHGVDFEGEFGVITDAVPMGVSPQQALRHICLVVQINDWSLRALAGREMKTGFGWIQAKPACSMAPVAVTPKALGPSWREARPDLDLLVDWNGVRFGRANGSPMEFGFHELIAHAARTRSLPAGTVIGSGTVSNANFREVGSSCIAERRGIEIVDQGEAKTGFMRFGDRVRMEARTKDGAPVFGAIDQAVIPFRPQS